MKINPKKRYNKVSQNNRKTYDEMDKEKDTFKFNQITLLVVENMNLQPGIVIIQEGKIKVETKLNTVDLQNMNNLALRMTRYEYISLTQQINSTINHKIQIKVNVKSIKQIDKDKGFNYDRFKRFSQQMNNYGELQTSEKLPKVTLQQQNSKSSQENTSKKVKNPVDQFNLQLYKNNVVGRYQQNEIGFNYKKLKTKKILNHQQVQEEIGLEKEK
ncbi:unnamed protein product [Paramecium sonneborni]|uniref:Uncharacterized protein n=1 Tax=Paramecium sonneborni TaxID=65129 RepID=A0A8S1NUK1_9CILI|nr:unnamed protein product [Paramecium sonneborni]